MGFPDAIAKFLQQKKNGHLTGWLGRFWIRYYFS